MKVERQTVHVSDDSGRIAMLETRTFGTDPSPATLERYIYSNHLQSASLELDASGDIISYEEYHPYGTTSYQAMNASINAVAKRYRYTGKERDEESGLYYHGARYYIPWLCRWCAPEPLNSLWYNSQNIDYENIESQEDLNNALQAKYPTLSSYCYCANNPVICIDPDGRDARIAVEGNTITISSTIHIIGGSDKDRQTFIESANEFAGNMKKWGNTSGKYTDENGQEWIIKIEVNYVEGGSQDFIEGDNTLDISRIYEEGGSKVEGGDKWSKEEGWDYNTTGNEGTMRGGERNIIYGFTTFHETLHFLGLSDRYEGNGEIVQLGYEVDIMSGRGTGMHQNHWNNWGKYILNYSKSNFILKHKVDKTGDEKMKYIQPENIPTKRGTR